MTGDEQPQRPTLAAQVERLRITPEILSLIAEIDEFKGAWRAIGRLAPDRLSALRKVATIESIGSSTRIEGARLTDQQVEDLLSAIEVQSLSTPDEQEVAGYAGVMDVVFENYQTIDVTENHIKQLHRDLLEHSHKDEHHRGSYKKVPNHVEASDAGGNSLGVVFETASPFEAPVRMQELIEWTRKTQSTDKLHPLLVTSVFTAVFLAIHPFQDGNGRLSRALTTLLHLRAGYEYVPYTSLESVIEGSKDGYYLSLRQTQATLGSSEPDWAPWTSDSLGALKEQKDRLAKKMEVEHLALASLPELSRRLLELAREHGRVTVAEAVRATGVSRNTIKDHLSTLVRSRQLTRHGSGRGTWYSMS